MTPASSTAFPGAAGPHVVVVGAGGLGGPLAYALAAAGCRLTVCDPDVVELSNLQRQVQFTTADIGRRKVDALADELARRGHPRAAVRALPEGFEPATADRIAGQEPGSDRDDPGDPGVIVDGSDDFATKFAVNDWAVARAVPFVIASVTRYTGQVFAGQPGAGAGCYRCLFEAPPGADEADQASCARAGVLGAAVAVIAGLAARAALDLAGGRPPLGHPGGGLWVVDDVRRARLRAIAFAPRPDCPAENPANLSLEE